MKVAVHQCKQECIDVNRKTQAWVILNISVNRGESV